MIERYRPTKSQDQLVSLSKVGKRENRTLVNPVSKLPKELAGFFANPPLVGDESREDYENLFLALATDAKPADAIAWLYFRDFADLAWEERREKWLKQRVIEDARKAVITELLMPPQINSSLDNADELEAARDAEVEQVFEEMKQWERDPEARGRIDKELASEGFDADYILTEALIDGADRVDAIDRRISMYQNRRHVVLREIDRYSESMARRLDKASSDIMEGEFTEAAE